MVLPEFFTVVKQSKGCIVTVKDRVLAERADQSGIGADRVNLGIVWNEDPLGKTGISMALLRSDLRASTNQEIMDAIEINIDDMDSTLPTREVAEEQRRQIIATHGGM